MDKLFLRPKKYHLFNHVSKTLKYEQDPESGKMFEFKEKYHEEKNFSEDYNSKIVFEEESFMALEDEISMIGYKTEDISIYFNFLEINEDDRIESIECEFKSDRCETSKSTGIGRWSNSWIADDFMHQ